MDIRRVGIIIKLNHAGAVSALRELCDWLRQRDIEALLDPASARAAGTVPTHTKAEIPKQADLIVVLGGDGTLLAAARLLADFEVPLLGINLGSLGFLTEIPYPEMLETLERVVAGDVCMEQRTLLHAEVLRGEELVASSYCLNDVVVAKGTVARLIRLHVWVDGKFVTGLRADGLIVATPTGSTAYSMSAGGPIAHPRTDAVVLTPISPHVLSHRPVILPADSLIRIKVVNDEAPATVTFDGQVGFSLRTGDVIEVRSAKRKLNLIVSPERNYYEVLRTKLKWGGDLVP